MSVKLETVNRLSDQIRKLFRDFKQISVRGELSNVRVSKGHTWFELLHLDTEQQASSGPTVVGRREKIGGVIWKNTLEKNISESIKQGVVVVSDARGRECGGA